MLQDGHSATDARSDPVEYGGTTPKHQPMTDSTMILEPLASDLYPVPDSAGTVSWQQALMFAFYYGNQCSEIIVSFTKEYDVNRFERIDLGELNVWINNIEEEIIEQLMLPQRRGIMPALSGWIY